MSANEQQAQAATAATTEAAPGESLLDTIVSATKMTERPIAQDLISTLIDEVTKGTVTWDKNVTRTINAGIAAIDQALSKQLAAIMHNSDLQKLEGSWRGLQHLVMNSETSTMLKLKVFNVTKRDLFKD